jgi:hypothetical protein
LPLSPEEWPHSALPTSAQEPHRDSLWFSGSIRCGRCFPLVMPFLWKFPPRVPDKELIDAAKLPCLAASALCPLGVARVSRLIGKFDTTACRSGWQVHFGVIHSSDLVCSARMRQRQETPLPSEWRFLSCAGHWPPKQMASAVSAAPSAGFPAGFPFVGAASLAVALAGSCCSWGWPGFSPAAGTSLAPSV